MLLRRVWIGLGSMMCAWALLVGLALAPRPAAAQAPTETPSPTAAPTATPTPSPPWWQYCADGKFGECLVHAKLQGGTWLLWVIAGVTLIILFLINAPKLIEDWSKLRDRIHNWIRKSTKDDTRSPQLPIIPDEPDFIDLEMGRDARHAIRQEIRLATRQEISEGQGMYREEDKKFSSLNEAVDWPDPRNPDRPFPALVLLGVPGAGKTTLLHQYYRDLEAQYRLDPAGRQPLWVSLGQYRGGKPVDFLRQCWHLRWKDHNFDDVLGNGRLWLLADGLNEMKQFDQYTPDWRVFVNEYLRPEGNRALFACRQDDYWEALGLPRLLVHKMDKERIQEFLHKRIPECADKVWKDLEHDRQERNGRLYQLAEIPFWLVRMAEAAEIEGLPKNRSGLMEESIQRWLERGAERSGSNLAEMETACQQGFTRLGWHGLWIEPNHIFSRSEAERTLRRWRAPAPEKLLELARQGGLLKVSEGSVQFYHQLLQEYFAGCELSARFLRLGRLYRLDTSFQRAWRIPWPATSNGKKKIRWLRENKPAPRVFHWDPLPGIPLTHWEEATVMAAGMLPPHQCYRFIQVVLRHNPHLAARCALESEYEATQQVQQAVKDRLQDIIQDERQRLPLRLDAGKDLGSLGSPLILRGETSARVGERNVPCIEPDWVPVLAGAFRMGTSDEDAQALQNQKTGFGKDEQPDHLVSLSAFSIGRYPVTVAEYRCFWEAGGYKDEGWWPDEIAQRWRQGELTFEESYPIDLLQNVELAKQKLPQLKDDLQAGKIAPEEPLVRAIFYLAQTSTERERENWQERESSKRDGQGKAQHPWLWEDTRFTNPSQPVIGVTWYEARAYTLWITEMLRAAKKLPEDMCIRLPTEAEWERTARGVEGYLWPWGNVWDVARCNSFEGRVWEPSPIGIYPHGASPCGVLDMVGNVWEWCLDWYAEDTYAQWSVSEVLDPYGPETGQARVLRGGSWNYNRHGARCAVRYRPIPDYFDDVAGFRLVRSPNRA